MLPRLSRYQMFRNAMGCAITGDQSGSDERERYGKFQPHRSGDQDQEKPDADHKHRADKRDKNAARQACSRLVSPRSSCHTGENWWRESSNQKTAPIATSATMIDKTIMVVSR
ncbi:hypothetical protein [uncultured Roseibium sp.]|uniref:hypothetical protein n=1 Tax=uncultured Roseibium sp. TaxID=1936171 RepID=UPI00262B8210|nr:hypothetical protein [uncultured Roseibium sp.]